MQLENLFLFPRSQAFLAPPRQNCFQSILVTPRASLARPSVLYLWKEILHPRCLTAMVTKPLRSRSTHIFSFFFWARLIRIKTILAPIMAQRLQRGNSQRPFDTKVEKDFITESHHWQNVLQKSHQPLSAWEVVAMHLIWERYGFTPAITTGSRLSMHCLLAISAFRKVSYFLSSFIKWWIWSWEPE